MRPTRTLIFAALLCATATAAAQDSRWGVRASFGPAWLLLGSEDIREGISLGVNYSMPHPRLRFRSHHGELEMEAYAAYTSSTGASSKPPNRTLAGGLLAMGRYKGRSRNGVAGYIEIGWGLQYADQRTVDLNSRLNSTPTFGFGVATKTPDGHQAYIGVRLMHISNGGLSGDNQGQNFFMGTLSVKF